MWVPECKGNPGRVGSEAYWCSGGDYGGVHMNSGISNHAFALLADGGSYNGRVIDGVGLDHALHIFWRAFSTYLTPVSDFSDLANGIEAACADLIGFPLPEPLPTGPSTWGNTLAPLTSGNCAQVTEVVLATELRDITCWAKAPEAPSQTTSCGQSADRALIQTAL